MIFLINIDSDELKVLGAALADRPYRESAPIIAKISRQVSEQEAASDKEKERPQEPTPPAT